MALDVMYQQDPLRFNGIGGYNENPVGYYENAYSASPSGHSSPSMRLLLLDNSLDPNIPRVLSFRFGEKVAIGRSPTGTHVIKMDGYVDGKPAAVVSRIHAYLTASWDGRTEGYYVEDNASTNGVTVTSSSGEEIRIAPQNQLHPVGPGDTVLFGLEGTGLRYILTNDRSSPAPSPQYSEAPVPASYHDQNLGYAGRPPAEPRHQDQIHGYAAHSPPVPDSRQHHQPFPVIPESRQQQPVQPVIPESRQYAAPAPAPERRVTSRPSRGPGLASGFQEMDRIVAALWSDLKPMTPQPVPPKVILVGMTGAGKSSLCDALCKFPLHTSGPQHGGITFGETSGNLQSRPIIVTVRSSQHNTTVRIRASSEDSFESMHTVYDAQLRMQDLCRQGGAMEDIPVEVEICSPLIPRTFTVVDMPGSAAGTADDCSGRCSRQAMMQREMASGNCNVVVFVKSASEPWDKSLAGAFGPLAGSPAIKKLAQSGRFMVAVTKIDMRLEVAHHQKESPEQVAAWFRAGENFCASSVPGAEIFYVRCPTNRERDAVVASTRTSTLDVAMAGYDQTVKNVSQELANLFVDRVSGHVRGSQLQNHGTDALVRTVGRAMVTYYQLELYPTAKGVVDMTNESVNAMMSSGYATSQAGVPAYRAWTYCFANSVCKRFEGFITTSPAEAHRRSFEEYERNVHAAGQVLNQQLDASQRHSISEHLVDEQVRQAKRNDFEMFSYQHIARKVVNVMYRQHLGHLVEAFTQALHDEVLRALLRLVDELDPRAASDMAVKRPLPRPEIAETLRMEKEAAKLSGAPARQHVHDLDDNNGCGRLHTCPDFQPTRAELRVFVAAMRALVRKAVATGMADAKRATSNTIVHTMEEPEVFSGARAHRYGASAKAKVVVVPAANKCQRQGCPYQTSGGGGTGKTIKFCQHHLCPKCGGEKSSSQPDCGPKCSGNNKPTRAVGVVVHNFTTDNAMLPTKCDFCKKMMRGKVMKCSQCKAVVHIGPCHDTCLKSPCQVVALDQDREAQKKAAAAARFNDGKIHRPNPETVPADMWLWPDADGSYEGEAETGIMLTRVNSLSGFVNLCRMLRAELVRKATDTFLSSTIKALNSELMYSTLGYADDSFMKSLFLACYGMDSHQLKNLSAQLDVHSRELSAAHRMVCDAAVGGGSGVGHHQ